MIEYLVFQNYIKILLFVDFWLSWPLWTTYILKHLKKEMWNCFHSVLSLLLCVKDVIRVWPPNFFSSQYLKCILNSKFNRNLKFSSGSKTTFIKLENNGVKWNCCLIFNFIVFTSSKQNTSTPWKSPSTLIHGK